MRHLPGSVLIATLFLGGAVGLSPAEAFALPVQETDEIQVKAAMIAGFARYCDWPDKALPKEAPFLVVGLIGPDAVCEKIQKLTQGKKAGQRTIKVVRGASPADLAQAQIVYLAQAEKSQAPDLLQTFRDSPVLTIGEVPGFAKEGGVVNFYLAEVNGASKVHFELNPDAADRAGLKVTRLVKVAPKIVRDR